MFPPHIIQVTGIQAEPTMELSSLRIDSLGLVLLVQRLSNALGGMPVAATDFYRFDTVDELATDLYRR